MQVPSPNYPDYDPMYPVIRYTQDDMTKLIGRYNQYDQAVPWPYDTVETVKLYIILEEGMENGVYPGGKIQASETETNHHLSTLEHDYYREYKAMYLDRLEDIPLLINDEELGIIARWRLEIGK